MQLRRFGKSRDGNGAVEFAIIAPVLLTMMLSLTDFGLLWHSASGLGSAARIGAQAMVNANGSSSGVAEMVSASVNGGPQVTEARSFCRCPVSLAEVDCTTSCSGQLPEAYVAVAVQASYDWLFVSYGMPDPLTVTRRVELRVR